jgi:hypothetical protein
MEFAYLGVKIFLVWLFLAVTAVVTYRGELKFNKLEVVLLVLIFLPCLASIGVALLAGFVLVKTFDLAAWVIGFRNKDVRQPQKPPNRPAA